jgi:hypothetical protein
MQQIQSSRQVISLESGDRASECIARIAHLDDLVAVNIAKADDPRGVFFCADNVRALTAQGAGTFVIETLAATDHARFMRAAADQAIDAVEALREALRFQPVSGCAGAARALLERFDRLLLMLEGYVMQRSCPKAGAANAALSDAREEIARALEAADGVACMDAVRYVLVPALKAVRSAF